MKKHEKWKERIALRPNSITTRIETEKLKPYCFEGVHFKTEFHYNKDWNLQTYFPMWGLLCNFKTEFHYNKDWNVDVPPDAVTVPAALRPNSITTRIETR